jgi:ribosome-associated protein YbcJ (S4-like RNA binding protein)
MKRGICLVKIKQGTITLGQLLKKINVIGSGAEAKDYLARNIVLVNGEQEARRGRKLVAHDKITIEGSVVELEYED